MTTETTDRTNETPRRRGHPIVNRNPERIGLELPGELLARLRAHTSARGQSISWWLRQAIAEKLEREQ